MKKIAENIIRLEPEDYDKMLKDSEFAHMLSPDADLGGLIGTGEGSLVHLNEQGEVDMVDFGLCGFCGMGHYVSENPNSLFGVCNYCGAI